LVGYIRLFFAMVFTSSGGYLYSVRNVVVDLYGGVTVTRPYDTLGIAIMIIGLGWALYEGYSIGNQRRIQKMSEYMLST